MRDLLETSTLGTEGLEGQGEWHVLKIPGLVSHLLQSHRSGKVDWTAFMVPNAEISSSYSVTGLVAGGEGVGLTMTKGSGFRCCPPILDYPSFQCPWQQAPHQLPRQFLFPTPRAHSSGINLDCLGFPQSDENIVEFHPQPASLLSDDSSDINESIEMEGDANEKRNLPEISMIRCEGFECHDGS